VVVRGGYIWSSCACSRGGQPAGAPDTHQYGTGARIALPASRLTADEGRGQNSAALIRDSCSFSVANPATSGSLPLGSSVVGERQSMEVFEAGVHW